MPVNFGILQPIQSMSPRNTQVVGSNPADMMNAQTGQGKAFNDSMQGIAQMRRTNAEIPGVLSDNKVKQVQAEQAQFNWAHQQADIDALQKGGTDAWLKSLESHDPVSAQAFKKGAEDIKTVKIGNSLTEVQNIANLAHTIATSQNPWQAYQNNKGLMKTLNPDMPEFKSPDEMTHYMAGVSNTAMGYIQNAKFDQEYKLKVQSENAKDSELVKAQKETTEAQSAYNAIKDKESPEAQQALEVLKQRQQETQAIISGHSPVAQVTGGLVNAISNGASSVADRINNLGKDNTPAPTIPDGRVQVKSPDGTVGHIPQDQLKDAIAQGYSEVK